MIKNEEVYKIGLFNKPHGIHGEILFTFSDDVFDKVECGYLICLLDGIFVPFFIEEYRFRSDTTALIKLEKINTAEKARIFTNVEVYFPVKYITETQATALSWNYFIGFTIRDIKKGNIGEITEVDDSTRNVLFIIETKDQEILIPASDELIVEIDQIHKTITVNLPEGLLELSSS